MTISRQIESTKRRLLARYPYFGGVAAGIRWMEDPRVRNLQRKGNTIRLNPEWFSGLNEEERLFVCAREICYAALQHEDRGEGKDRQIWKAATEAVVNQLLRSDGMELMGGALDYPEAIEHGAEEYYEILLEQKLAIELVEGNMLRSEGGAPAASPEHGGGEGAPSGKDKNRGSTGEDNHDIDDDAGEDPDRDDGEEDPHADDPENGLPENEEELRKLLKEMEGLAEEMTEEEREQRNSRSSSDDVETEDGEDGDDGDGQKDGAGDSDDDSDDASDLEEMALIARRVSKAGNDPRPDIRDMPPAGEAPPVLDWRLLLRDSVRYGVDWSFQNATIEDGILRPALEERPMPETEIVVDTSWSVDEELLRRFLRECKNIFRLSKLKVGCFDTVFYGFHEIRREKDIDEMEFPGGGGTDFNAAAEAFTMRADNRIVFTDGQADVPEKKLNAIWLIYGEEDIQPPGGTVIHIPPDQI